MEENPYKAPTRAAATAVEPKPVRKRHAFQVWIVMAVTLTFATVFAIQGAVSVFHSAKCLAEYANGANWALDHAIWSGELAAMLLGLSVFMLWGARGFVRDVRRRLADSQNDAD